MIIEFQNVIPEPLLETYSLNSEVWNTSLKIEDAKKVLILANSGKGKSTLLQLIFGLRFDYSGIVKINNTDIRLFKKSDWTELRKSAFACVFQEMQLFPSISVLENLRVKNNLTKKYSEDDLIRFLDYFGLASHKDQKCSLMSMGQKQRIAIIRSVLQPFDCIILDEPFSHLDEANKLNAMNFILEHAANQNAAIVMSSLGETHNVQWDTVYNI